MRTRVLGLILILLLWFIALPLLAIDGRNATVYVYRPAALTGMAKRPSIYVDGLEIARLRSGMYLTFDIAPGRHLITSANYVEGNPSLNFESGKKYFFQLKVRSFAKTALGIGPPMSLLETPEPQALKDIETLKKTDVNQAPKPQSPQNTKERLNSTAE
jgi:hypothetical protein